MNTHTKRYARECIYCGATPPKLSKEHVIAKSLGGKLTLFEASCKVHADLTSELERTMAKETYGFVRAMTGVSTRNKDERTKFLNEKVPIKGTNQAGEEVTVEMRRSHTPAMPIALILPPPGLLSDAPPDVDAPIRYTMDIDSIQSAKMRRAHGLSEILWSGPPVTGRTIARVLAKTAHAFAWYELGKDGFVPMLLPLIVRDEGSCTYLVGGFEPQREQLRAPLAMREIEVDGNAYIVVDISLHAFPKMPLYQVIVGRKCQGIAWPKR